MILDRLIQGYTPASSCVMKPAEPPAVLLSFASGNAASWDDRSHGFTSLSLVEILGGDALWVPAISFGGEPHHVDDHHVDHLPLVGRVHQAGQPRRLGNVHSAADQALKRPRPSAQVAREQRIEVKPDRRAQLVG